MRIASLASLVALVACGGGSFVEATGTVNGDSFAEVGTIFHGGSFIVAFVEELECTDLAWIRKTYSPGQAPEGSPSDFTGLQFAFDDSDIQIGTFSLAGDAAVGGLGMWNQGGAFDYVRARDGVLTVTDVDAGGDWVEGQFNPNFGAEGVTGRFRSSYCVNLVR